MSGPTELLEQMEHAGHAGGGHGDAHGDAQGHGSVGKHIGISMACLGVLLAFCSALVGGTRTELVKTMVEQTTAQAKYQAQAIKYRVVVTQLQALVAGLPRPAELAAADASFARLEAEADTAPKDPKPVSESPRVPSPTAGLRLATRQMVDLLAPSKDALLKSATLVHNYRLERDAASDWIDSFDTVIRAHTEAGEHYEWAQLCAEVGIVIASIALLFSSRKVWSIALALGAVAVGILGWTYTTTRAELREAEHRIEESGHKYRFLRKALDDRAEEEEMLRGLWSTYGVKPPVDPVPPTEEHGGEHGKPGEAPKE